MAVASLPMYDLPPLRAATDAWWEGLARAFKAEGLTDVPDRLSRQADGHWRDPELLLGQTCGYPLTHGLDDAVQVVATPVYLAPGCFGPDYRSHFVVRAEETAPDLAALAGRRAAINGRDSQSGCNALRAAVAPLGGGKAFFGAVVETGAHAASLDAVRAGKADIAAIDCVTWALIAREMPDRVSGLRILGPSEAAPALPYVTAACRDGAEAEALRRGLQRACADPALAATREALLIGGVEFLARSAYDRIDEMEAAARRFGYPELN